MNEHEWFLLRRRRRKPATRNWTGGNNTLTFVLPWAFLTDSPAFAFVLWSSLLQTSSANSNTASKASKRIAKESEPFHCRAHLFFLFSPDQPLSPRDVCWVPQDTWDPFLGTSLGMLFASLGMLKSSKYDLLGRCVRHISERFAYSFATDGCHQHQLIIGQISTWVLLQLQVYILCWLLNYLDFVPFIAP